MKKTLLIVDDKPKLCETLSKTFEQIGYQAFSAFNGQEALRVCATQPIHVVLLDMMLGEENGIDVLKQIVLLHQHLPVIMMTGYASVETAVQSLKIGAFDYVKKPLDFEQLVKVVENALHVSSGRTNQRETSLASPAPRIVTQHPAMLEICQKAKKLATTDLPVLITGENGTGKEILADFIHLHSRRHSHKMVKVNCAAFPETLLDNELFGHEKGAFTGATTTFKGVFEKADASSLFLDEIGDMSLAIQAKILRTLQNREIRRLGGHSTITINVRFIAATNKDLKKLIQAEKFREDLLYRLNTAVLRIPPLRERKEDIPLLLDYFLHEYTQNNTAPTRQVSDAVQDKLMQYHWPGNVRELKNVINYAAAVSSHVTIELDDLPPDFLNALQHHAPENIREEMEKNLIVNMLQKTDYNKKKTAELLNMGRKTLYRKLKKYGIATTQ